MSFEIHGLGTATPPGSLPQTDALELAKQLVTKEENRDRQLAAIYRRTGVSRRHSILLDSDACASSMSERALTTHRATQTLEKTIPQSFYPPALSPEERGPSTAERMREYAANAGQLACQAVAAAFDQSGITPSEVTHLITVSCTGFQAPGVDLELIRDLGLPPQTSRTHVGFMGCHGALNALRVANAYATSEPSACVLIVCVELCSLHLQYGFEPDQVVANALFADGAAAVIGKAKSEMEPTTQRLSIAGNGSLVLPDSSDLMSWKIGDYGFEMTLSSRVPSLIHETLRPWLTPWLKSLGYALEDIESWVIHPGGPRILSACGEALELSREDMAASREILADYGNMSSPTVLFILERLLQSQSSPPVVMLAFGPGLTIEAALLDA